MSPTVRIIMLVVTFSISVIAQTESPHNTRVPPATQIVDSSGAVWTRTASGRVLRNGANTDGLGSVILYCNRIVYVFGTDSQWWQWTGRWVAVGGIDPCATPTPTPAPSPSPSPSPSLFRVDEFGQTTATNYDTWTTNGSYRIGGQTVLRWDANFSNFIGGKVATIPSFTGQQNFMFGNMVVCCPSGTANTTFGWDTGRPTTGEGNSFFGHDAGLGVNTGSYNTFVGRAAGVPNQSGTVQVSGSIAIGAASIATGDNQFVAGSAAAPINDAYFGQGVRTVSPRGFVLNASGGFGVDNAGGPLTLAAGRSTGSANPASIFFSVSTRGPSGPTLQPLVRRWEIDGTGDLKSLNGSKVKANPQLIDGVKPPCNEAARGQLWQTFGTTGQGDALEICMKTAAGLYVYRVLLFAQ